MTATATWGRAAAAAGACDNTADVRPSFQTWIFIRSWLHPCMCTHRMQRARDRGAGYHPVRQRVGAWWKLDLYKTAWHAVQTYWLTPAPLYPSSLYKTESPQPSSLAAPLLKPAHYCTVQPDERPPPPPHPPMPGAGGAGAGYSTGACRPGVPIASAARGGRRPMPVARGSSAEKPSPGALLPWCDARRRALAATLGRRRTAASSSSPL